MATETVATGLDAVLVRARTVGLDALVGFKETADLDALVKKTGLAETAGMDARVGGVVRLDKGPHAQDYTGQTGSFLRGGYVVGGTSGAIGLLVGMVDPDATGTLYFNAITGTFIPGETLYRGEVGSELITNGNMELDANWEAYGDDTSSLTEQRSSGQKVAGEYSWYMYDSNLPVAGRLGIQSAIFPTVTDTHYIVDFYEYADYVDPFCVVMVKGDGTLGADRDYSTPSPNDTWYNHSFIYLEDAGGSLAQFLFLAQDGWTSTWRYYLDNVSVKGIVKNVSHYATADGASYGTMPQLDALLKKDYSVSAGLDGIVLASCNVYDGTLPDLRIEASFGKTMSVDAKLPVLSCEARFGARSEGVLPALECEASIEKTEQITVDAKLPVLSCESRFGFRGPDAKLPALEIEAEIGGSLIMSLEKSLPPLEIEAEISTPGVVSVDVELPPLEIEATISREQTVSLDATLPALTIEASMGAFVFDVDALLPNLKLESLLSREGRLALDASLPAMKIEASMLRTSIGVDVKLPALEVEATMSREGRLALDAILPALQIEGVISRDAIFSVDTSLPAMKINANMDNYSIGVDAQLPSLKIDAGMSRQGAMSLDKALPALEIEAAISEAGTFDIDAILPAFKIECEFLAGQLISVEKNLPELQADISITSGAIMSLDASLPALIMGAVGTGGPDGSGSTITRTGRFDDYVLRHIR